MLQFSEPKFKMAKRRAMTKADECNSVRDIEKLVVRLNKSSDDLDRMTAIAIRAEILGDFKKAIKEHEKFTGERVRIDKALLSA